MCHCLNAIDINFFEIIRILYRYNLYVFNNVGSAAIVIIISKLVMFRLVVGQRNVIKVIAMCS